MSNKHHCHENLDCSAVKCSRLRTTSSLFSGVHGNYLKPSIASAGFDPDNLPTGDKTLMDFAKKTNEAKAWKDIWSAGQGVGSIDETLPAFDLVMPMEAEYKATKERLGAA